MTDPTRPEDLARAVPSDDMPPPPPADEPSEDEDERYGLSDRLVRTVRHAVENGLTGDLRTLVQPLHFADVADLIEYLDYDERKGLVEAIKDNFDPDILPELDEDVREEVIEILGMSSFAAAVEELDSDDAVYLVSLLEEDDQQEVLRSLSSEDRAIIETGLGYPEDSAGRLMQRELVAVPDYWSVGETIDYLRTGVELPEEFYELFVVDPRHHPVGSVKLARLLRAKRPAKLRDILTEDMTELPVTMDQEEVAYLFRQQNLITAPVVDENGRLVGRITIDDVVDVVDEEAQEDMLRLAGVNDDDLFSAVWDTVRSRVAWLFINMGTAIVASLVISMFEHTIEKVVALAVLMPIVASLGGNAGNQTLTVAVRALAMKELTFSNAKRVIGKEILVALLNGLMLAGLAATVAYFWFGQPMIAGVIAMAMVISFLAAGLLGTVIPLALEKAGADPAVASSVFLTTTIDVIGFLAFLGLATALIL